MAVRVPSWFPRLPENRGLQTARRALEGSLPLDYDERRVEPRLPVSEKGLPKPYTPGALLNISRSGFALQVPSRCRFARGEMHRLRFSVGPDAVDVEGLVCWTDSVLGGSSSSDTTEYSQIAGFEIPRTVSQDTLAILQIMRTMIRHMRVRVEVNGSQVVKACSENGTKRISSSTH